MSMRPEFSIEVVAVERHVDARAPLVDLDVALLTIVVPPSPTVWMPTDAQTLGAYRIGGAAIAPMSMLPELSMAMAPPSYSMSSVSVVDGELVGRDDAR